MEMKELVGRDCDVVFLLEPSRRPSNSIPAPMIYNGFDAGFVHLSLRHDLNDKGTWYGPAAIASIKVVE